MMVSMDSGEQGGDAGSYFLHVSASAVQRAGCMQAGQEGGHQLYKLEFKSDKKIKHLQQGSPNMQTETFNLHFLTQENVKRNIKWFNKKMKPSLFRLLPKSAPKSAFIP